MTRRIDTSEVIFREIDILTIQPLSHVLIYHVTLSAEQLGQILLDWVAEPAHTVSQKLVAFGLLC